MLEVYDCTLREGEQAEGVHFSIEDRINITLALNEFDMDFIEVGWPIHEEVLETLLKLNKEKLKSKIVAFGSTSFTKNPEEDKNLNSILKSKVKYACIFGKTWAEHVEKQLKISKKENLKKIFDSVKFLRDRNIKVFYDAEHYFDGFKHNSEYAFKTIEKAAEAGASKIILCDTNGGTLTEETAEIIEKTKQFIKEKGLKVELGAHIHNDSGLAFANSLEALKHVNHIQGTINGLGERVGNVDLCELIPFLMLKKKMQLNFRLDKLKRLSDLVYKAANLPRKIDQAFISSRAFSHKGGVHIDATSKGASYSHVMPESLGLQHSFALTSLGGKAGVMSAAKKFGFSVKKGERKITEVLGCLRDLERKGYSLGSIEAEQFMIIGKYFGNFRNLLKIDDWSINTNKHKSKCYLELDIDGEKIKAEGEVNGGPVEAIYKTIINALPKKYDNKKNLKLKDYSVRIVNPKGAASSVRTKISFSGNEEFSTVGVSENIIQSSLEAIEKAFNYYLYKSRFIKQNQ